MSHFEQLDPDQRIVLRMAVRRRRSYAAMAEALGAAPDEIRRRALAALDALAPEGRSELGDADRGRIADYLLGQQEGPARETTARVLGSAGPPRTWALLLEERLASLGEPIVAVPAAVATPGPDARPRRPRAARADSTGASRPAQPDDAAEPRAPKAEAGPSRSGRRPRRVGPMIAGVAPAIGRALRTGRRRALAGAGAVVVVLVVLLVAGVFGGGGGDGDDASAALPTATKNQALAVRFAAAMRQSIPFRAPAGGPAEFASVTGVATPTVSTQDASVPVLALTIKGLPATSATRNYFVWADRKGQDPVFLGQLPGTEGAQLPFQGVDVRTRQAVVVDPSVYSQVRVTSETTTDPTSPGQTVIVGTITPPSS